MSENLIARQLRSSVSLSSRSNKLHSRLIKMRLLKSPTLQLETFADLATPRYAILSHRWQAGEVTFEDMVNDQASVKASFKKLAKKCRQAANDAINTPGWTRAVLIRTAVLSYRRPLIPCTTGGLRGDLRCKNWSRPRKRFSSHKAGLSWERS